MVGTVRPAQAGFPHGGSEDNHGQEKEDAYDFKPDNSAHAPEGAQEAADAGSDTACSLSGNLAGGACLGGGVSGGSSWPAGCGLGTGGDALAGDAAGDTQADSEGAADGLRFHFALMVTARLGLRLGADGSQVPGCSPAALEVR